ncbi:MAG: MotA/TolQ/ExbB proton channel family protein [Puniceicoccaceae bacterium]
MEHLISGSGYFIYPIAVLSLVGLAITLERVLALRLARIAPDSLFEAILSGEDVPEPQANRSLLGEILAFRDEQKPSPETLRAFGIFQIGRLERGIFWIDVVVAGAPLLGLLGTVTGLVKVFSGILPGEAMPDTSVFVEGIGLALTTTILGLAAAIPALIAGSYLNRRVQVLSARLNVAVEKLAELPAK